MVITGDIPLADIPASIARPPDGAIFKLTGGVTMAEPHPYCITPKHLEYADSMVLDAASIARAEQRGAVCDICREEKRRPILSYSQHKQEKALAISVYQNTDLNAITGLYEYLSAIKKQAEQDGFSGFVFPLIKEESYHEPSPR